MHQLSVLSGLEKGGPKQWVVATLLGNNGLAVAFN